MIGQRRLVTMIVFALMVAACGGDDSEATTTSAGSVDTTEDRVTTTVEETTTTSGAAGDPQVVIEGFAFNAPSTVSVGETVVVTNRDAASHTWTAEGGVFDSGTLGQGDTFEFTFEDPGEIDFFCAIHPTTMTGTITVEG